MPILKSVRALPGSEAWLRENIDRAAHYRDFMNSRPQVRGATLGACWGTAGRGRDAGSPAPFVMTDGGMRRARPAGPPDLRPRG